MKKYKLISLTTKQETICDKVVVDGFDYYVSDDFLRIGDYGYWDDADVISQINDSTAVSPKTKKVIATNNPDLDLPKVVDYAHKLACNASESSVFDTDREIAIGIAGFYEGYNKSQETHPYSASDMIEFQEWRVENLFSPMNLQSPILWRSNNRRYKELYTTRELLQIWEEQRHQTIYIN